MNREILEAALAGLEAQKHKLDSHIASVRSLLGGKPAPSPSKSLGAVSAPVKRVLSVEARKRIAAAQKKRWAAYRKSQG